MKTILITGGAGFIGSNFVRYLYSKYPNYRLIVLDALTYAGNVKNLPVDINNGSDERLTFWYGNVRNAELVDTVVSQADVVMHFAAESHVTRSIYDNLLFFETDVLGTQAVANAVLKYRDKVERFIHISTSEVYGTAESDKMSEAHPLLPMSPYASAKCGADRLVYSYWQTYGIPAIIIRPFNNYGPYQHLEKVVPRFITSCILGEPITVHGDGAAARDFIYVQDHCAPGSCADQRLEAVLEEHVHLLAHLPLHAAQAEGGVVHHLVHREGLLGGVAAGGRQVLALEAVLPGADHRRGAGRPGSSRSAFSASGTAAVTSRRASGAVRYAQARLLHAVAESGLAVWSAAYRAIIRWEFSSADNGAPGTISTRCAGRADSAGSAGGNSGHSQSRPRSFN